MQIFKRLFGRVGGPPFIAAPQTQTKAAEPTLGAVVAEPAAARPALGVAPQSAGRVLLVEDNFVNERVAVYMLTKLGHQVDVAKHGREAIDMLGKAGYDLVLMDCQMPEMDGFEATRVIRDRSSAVLDHEIPVIAMTANALPEARARPLACSMKAFLPTPLAPSVT